MEIFVFWFLFSILVGVFASTKGRSWIGFFVLALLISPLIAGIIVLLLSPITSKVEKKEISRGNMKKCTSCAELVKMEAKVCKHCGHTFAV